MGYTHHFPHKKVSDDVWNKIVTACRKLKDNSPVAINGCRRFEDDKDPGARMTDEFIWFNGVGADGHETFVLEKKGSGGFSFCKTAHKPYDLMVTACLLVYNHYSPDTIELSSDGNNADWEDGVAFVNEILDLGVKAPF